MSQNRSDKPVIWSIAGNDSGGGAGLAADLRAAAAFGVHLCPVVAAVTAQNSRAVTRIEPVPPDWLDAQLTALDSDLPPAAIKTGLLGSAAHVAVVARWIDRLRQSAPVALVVDPVLAASTGAAFADLAAIDAYRGLLLPRATVVTPNKREARMLAGQGGHGDESGQGGPPALAAALKALGAGSVGITGGDDPRAAPGWSLDWIDTPHASGWLALPRVQTPHSHGTGCTFATGVASALALGFVPADAMTLAKMATTLALHHGHAAGQGAGPVAAQAGFGMQPDLLPWLSWDEDASFLDFTLSHAGGGQGCGPSNLFVDASARQINAVRPHPNPPPEGEGAKDIGVYAIVDSAERVRQVVAAGARTVQLRIKTPANAPDAALRQSIAQALAACNAAGATLVVNDHWRLARELGARAVHLGQEDLAALGQAGHAELAASGLKLGISSHSLWELCRARGLQPWYIACGPVWPTLTKAMPWAPQGLDNLAWWVRMAGAPVVAIGGILEPAQLTEAARSGASGVCVVRGLGNDPAQTLPRWQAALAAGRAALRLPAPALPHSPLRRG